MSSRLAARAGSEVVVTVLELELQVDELLSDGGDPGLCSTPGPPLPDSR
ncbi:hypothetical protein [Streptomyces sp. NPDC046197]